MVTDPRVSGAVVDEALVVTLSGDLDIEVGPALRAPRCRPPATAPATWSST